MADYEELHKWNLPIKEAIKLQVELSKKVSLSNGFDKIRRIAGVDIAFSKDRGLGYGAIVILDYSTLNIIETASSVVNVTFPYIPGLLTFREGPIFLEAWKKVKVPPDVVMFDGQGIAHPRNLGLAAHMGLWINIPSIGVAKSRLVGDYEEPEPERGSSTTLTYKGKKIGEVVRTRYGIKPLFISPGHLCSFETATRLVIDTAVKYRLPEPTRLAHKEAAKVKEAYLSSAGPDETVQSYLNF